MVNWEQIIPVTLVVGIVGFILTTAFNEYNQPRIQTEIVSVNKTKGENRWNYYINIKNAGVQPATGVRTTFHFINGYVMQYRVIFTSENATFMKQSEPDKVVINSTRLSPYGSIYVYTRVTDVKRPLFAGNGSKVTYSGPVVTFAGQYIISSSYKEGGSPFIVSSNLTSSNQTLLESYGKYTPLRETVSFSTQVIQYGLVFLIIASGVLFYYLRRKMRLNKAVEKLYCDLLYINNELETIPSSGEVFSQIEKWPNIKLSKVFGANPTDVLIIRNVFRKLKHRNENIPPDNPGRWLLNRGCLNLTNEALSSIDWKKYENLRGNRRSLLVMAAVEVFAIFFFLHTYGKL